MASKVVNTRIQLKSDTEASWNKAGPKDGSRGFVPLSGELIIYSADEAHPFSRLKVGDGNTNVVDLPFIDAGTVGGESLPEESISTYATFDLFPSPGEANKLYVDLSTGIIYCYTNSSAYTQLSNFTYTLEKTNVSNITYWNAGNMTNLSCSDGILITINGTAPTLEYDAVEVVTNIIGGNIE